MIDFTFAGLNMMEQHEVNSATVMAQLSLEKAKETYMAMHQKLSLRIKIRTQRRWQDDPSEIPDVVKAMKEQEELLQGIREIDECLLALTHAGRAMIEHRERQDRLERFLETHSK